MDKRLVISACALAACGLALAKLPPQDDAAKAKAAETAARAAWQAKVDAFKLCNVQNRIASQFGKSGARAGTSVPSAATVQTAAAPASGSAPATGTPVANVGSAPVTIPPCSDPGPFAYHPPAQIPLETSGAHSPAANAATPPSVRPESAKMAPAGGTTEQSKKP